MKIFLPWIGLFAAVQAALSLIQYLLRKRADRTGLRVVLILFKAALAVAFAFLVMAGPVFLRPVQPLLVALYAALLPDAAADLLCLLADKLRKKERRFAPYKLLSLALGCLFFVYGTWNMQTVTPERHTFTSDKLTQTHKLVFVSDLHVGSSQSFETTRGIVEQIRAEQPDCVILGGDITDDYTSKAEMEETYRLFGALGVPVYYIDGNHEVVQHAEYLKNGLPYTPEELADAMDAGGIIVLKDAYAELAPDLMLLGREDAASAARTAAETLTDPAPDRYLVVADHQPGSVREHAALGADLQLSGHTHAGQLFPLRWINSLFIDAYGVYDYDGTTLVVSAGASGWRVPFRTDAHCRYEVVTLEPDA